MLTVAAPSVRRPDRSDAIVASAAVGGIALLVWLGLGLTFFADEWGVIAGRTSSVPDLLRPFNEHWLAVTIVVYRAMLDLFGMHSYLPFHVLLAVTHAAVAILVYALVRRRTLRPVAVAITVVVLLFGSGFENLFWSIQIDFVGATALGLGALLLMDDVPTLPGRGRAAAAAGLLTIAVMTSGYGLFVLGLVGFDLLVDPRRRRWLIALLVPAGIYGAWYLAYGRTGIATHGDPFTIDRLLAIPSFVGEGMASAFGSAVGGGSLAGFVVGALLAIWIGALAIRGRTIPKRALACLLAIAFQYVLLGAVRSGLGVDAAVFTRYTYFSGIVALICAASLVGRPAIPRRRMPLAAGIGISLLILSLTWNVAMLVAGRDLFAQRAELTRAFVTVATTDPLADGIDPNLDLVLVPSPNEVRRVVAAYGSPLTDSLVPGAVPAVSAAALHEASQRAQHPPDWLLVAETRP